MKIVITPQQRIDFTKRFLKALVLRNHQNKSLGELSVFFGISRTLLHKWKNTDALPSIYTAKVICDTLNVSYEWLLTGVGDIDGFQMTNPDEIALIEKYRNLTKQGKRKIMVAAFTECDDHEITPTSKADRLASKQTALKLINTKD